MSNGLINKVITNETRLGNLIKINKDINLLIKLRAAAMSSAQVDVNGDYYVGNTITSSQNIEDIKKIEGVMVLVEQKLQGIIKRNWQEIAANPITSTLVENMVKKINHEKLYYKRLTGHKSISDKKLQIKGN